MKKLIALAQKLENKLGLASGDDAQSALPKKLQKIAKAEKRLQKKIARQQARINKVSEEVTVKTATGRVPGVYLVCNDCDGRGKTASSTSDLTVKFASVDAALPATTITVCSACKGKRVVKVADIRKCSEAQMNDRAQYVKDKADTKTLKKVERKKKKAAKAVAKAEQKRIEAENPMAFKAAKLQKKANKKAKRAAKKAMKAIDKAQRAESKLQD